MKPSLAQSLQEALQHQIAGRLAQAEAGYRKILQQFPEQPDALNLLGIIATSVGNYDAAVKLISRAIQRSPSFADYHNNLGEALRNQGRLDEAIACYRRAIALKSDHFEAHNNLAAAFLDKGDFKEAIASSQRALQYRPNLVQAYSNLGIAFAEMGELDRAIEAHQRAIAADPNLPDLYNNLANALMSAGRLDEAIQSRNSGLDLAPEDAEARSNLLMTLHYHSAYDDRKLFDSAREWNRRHAKRFAQSASPHANDPSPQRRLRIGYVSADFKQHASAYFLDPLMRNHDHARHEIYFYAQVRHPDAFTARFRSLSDVWRPITGLSDDVVAEQIRNDQIDVLVDLKLHTDDNRLLVFARKPAPVQVTWLGYPGTTGLDAIDYRLTDPHLDPQNIDESVYSERSYRLPNTFWCYDPLTTNPAVNSLPALTARRFTFGSLNANVKVNGDVLETWARVLRSVENSRLLLLASNQGSRRRIVDRLQRCGVPAERVEFLSKMSRHAYLEAYHQIDFALDTFPYNGHTTSLDALWMGVPMVALVGDTVVGRAGVSQLSNLNLREFIAPSRDEYVRIATDIASNLPRLAELRTTLRQRMESSTLMDAQGFARAMENAYRWMWERWCAQQK